jgi:carboxyl-terminal processing protease
MENLILDLRGNPGGYLNIVVNIAQLLVPEGEVVYMEDKHGNRVRTYNSELKERDFEVVVLIDEYSASASEILAGALKDREAGTLIGKKTFGKGSVQTLIDLRDGSAVKLTVQKYFTPSGSVIDGVGVSPHIEVEQPIEANFSNFVYKGQLEVGSSGLDVVILHKILYFLGYGEDRDDPNFTEITKEGVMEFQRAYGLPVTGIVDRKTGEKVNTVFEEFQRENDLQLQKAIEFFRNN